MLRWMSLMAIVAAATTAAVRGDNIDEGFKQDGKTTYCQGIPTSAGDVGDLYFDSLQAFNQGRCPVDVGMKASLTTIKQNVPIDVTWHVTGREGDIPDNIFPNAINPATGIPYDVVKSLMRACLSGTNCGTVINPEPVGPEDAESGAFNAERNRDLRTYRFQFADVGEYVIVGKVVLPGDDSLGLSETDYFAFQSIKVLDPNAPIPPSDSGSGSKASTTPTSDASKDDKSTPAPKTDGKGASTEEDGTISKGVESIPDESSPGTQKSADDDDSSNSSTTLLIIVIGSCAVVLVVGYVIAMRRKKGRQAKANKMGGLPLFGISEGQDSAMGYVAKKSGRNSQGMPIMGRPSTSSSEGGGMDMAHRGSEMNSSFNHGQPAAGGHSNMRRPSSPDAYQPQNVFQLYSAEASHKYESPVDMSTMKLSALYTDTEPLYVEEEDRGTAVYQGPPTTEEVAPRDYYESEADVWDPSASATASSVAFDPEESSRTNRAMTGGSFSSELNTGREIRVMSDESYSSEAVVGRETRGMSDESYASEAVGGREMRGMSAESYSSEVVGRDVRGMSGASYSSELEGRGTRAMSGASYTSDGMFDQERSSRLGSVASIDSYAYRPSDASVADSYMSRYSTADSELDSNRTSGISLLSDADLRSVR